MEHMCRKPQLSLKDGRLNTPDRLATMGQGLHMHSWARWETVVNVHGALKTVKSWSPHCVTPQQAQEIRWSLSEWGGSVFLGVEFSMCEKLRLLHSFGVFHRLYSLWKDWQTNKQRKNCPLSQRENKKILFWFAYAFCREEIKKRKKFSWEAKAQDT